uniref:hypothetical protein n=1 Tax=Microbacterium testaceum TaxID=2033 RepID=UPI0035945D1F
MPQDLEFSGRQSAQIVRGRQDERAAGHCLEVGFAGQHRHTDQIVQCSPCAASPQESGEGTALRDDVARGADEEGIGREQTVVGQARKRRDGVPGEDDDAGAGVADDHRRGGE